MDLSAYAALFNEFPTLSFIFLFITSACVGSFLNVVIYRLPVMMMNQWRCECEELLADDLKHPPTNNDDKKFNLAWPPSRCPSCEHKIKAHQNIPILSWLLLGGKCGNCKTSISIRYPSIELLTAILSTAIIWLLHGHAELTSDSLLRIGAELILLWGIIAATFIDLDHMVLPDNITLPLLWLGLALSIFGLGITPEAAILGAMIGYLSLWSVYWLFKILTGKEGMGHGDFKLLAVFGAWLGWKFIPIIILLSSLVGAIIGILVLSLQKKGKETPIPFGPYISIAGIVAWLWGEQIIQYYLENMLNVG